MPTFSTNAGASLAAAGSDFGTLILGVGNAVAQTQLQLTQTSVASTSALAQTIVDVIAVQETIYDDNGNVSSAQSFTQKLPLIDFIDPVFYQWTYVRLQGLFNISEIATASSASGEAATATSSSGQAGLLLIFGGGQTVADGAFNTSSSSSNSDTASAVGLARMYAQINPRDNVGVPKPTQVVQGPSLNVVQGALTELPGGGAPPTSRTLSLLIQLRRIDGTAITGAAISVETDGMPWAYADPTKTTTDATGNLAVNVQRTFVPAAAGAPPTDTTPVPVVVTVRLGLVANSVTVSI